MLMSIEFRQAAGGSWHGRLLLHVLVWFKRPLRDCREQAERIRYVNTDTEVARKGCNRKGANIVYSEEIMSSLDARGEALRASKERRSLAEAVDRLVYTWCTQPKSHNHIIITNTPEIYPKKLPKRLLTYKVHVLVLFNT